MSLGSVLMARSAKRSVKWNGFRLSSHSNMVGRTTGPSFSQLTSPMTWLYGLMPSFDTLRYFHSKVELPWYHECLSYCSTKWYASEWSFESLRFRHGRAAALFEHFARGTKERFEALRLLLLSFPCLRDRVQNKNKDHNRWESTTMWQ